MNGICRDLKFTVESQNQYPDNHLPTLDAKISLLSPEEGPQVVTYTYYEKEVNTKYTTLEASAMCPEETNQMLSQEVLRRMSRCDQSRSQEERDSIIDDFSKKLLRSGHSVNQCRSIITSGLRCYKRKIQEAKNKGERINRRIRCPKSRLKGMIKKSSDKTTRFKSNPNKENTKNEPTQGRRPRECKPKTDLRKTVAVVTVPRSWGGDLVKALRKAEVNL